MAGPARSLVVVNFGSHQLLATHLAPELTAAGIGVVVVDNYFSAAERSAVTTLATERGWTLVARADNDGFGVAVNAGAKEAIRLGSSALVFLNPDATMGTAALTALFEQVESAPDDLVGVLVTDSEEQVVARGSELELATGRLRSLPLPAADLTVLAGSSPGWVPWLTGACLGIHRSLWERSGGFAADYFLYWEDVDFSRRISAVGGRLVLRRDLVVTHDEGGTQGRTGRAKSDLYYFYNCRNRLVFASRNLSRGDVIRWVLRTPQESAQIWLRGGRRQLFTHPASVWAATRGSWSGLRMTVRAMVRIRVADGE